MINIQSSKPSQEKKNASKAINRDVSSLSALNHTFCQRIPSLIQSTGSFEAPKSAPDIDITKELQFFSERNILGI